MDASTPSLCSVCGYDLGKPTWRGNWPSFEICPCCGIQFGYDDATGGDKTARQEIYRRWRRDWIKRGMHWWSSRPAPSDWNPIRQLQRIGIRLDELPGGP